MAQNEVYHFNTTVDVDPYVVDPYVVDPYVVDPYVYSLVVDNMYSVY